MHMTKGSCALLLESLIQAGCDMDKHASKAADAVWSRTLHSWVVEPIKTGCKMWTCWPYGLQPFQTLAVQTPVLVDLLGTGCTIRTCRHAGQQTLADLGHSEIL